MRFFCLPNLSSTAVEETQPSTFKRPGFDSKEEFRAWCNEISTKHCFYSHVEGVIPSLRVTKYEEDETSNPPLYMHGLTIDFDSDMNLVDAMKQVTRNAPEGLMPRYASQTFSNGVRLTWEFDEPVMVDNKDITLRFMEELFKLIGAKSLLAGLDPASLKPTQYYEAGLNWTEFPKSKAISKKDLMVVFYRAAGSIKIPVDVAIPLEAVAAEVETRWPGRVKNFEEGQRVPLFWVEPFEDRVGAQIGQFGMICYSSRAGASFRSWSEILGPEFTREFTAKRIGAAVENFYYDGRHYWYEGDGFWANTNKEDTIMHLKSMGINPRPAKNKFTSEAEDVLVAIQRTNRVVAAAPFIHDSRKIVIFEGDRMLNTSTRKLIHPADSGAEAKFPWLQEFFDKIWAEPKQAQRDHYLAWLRHAYINCLEGKPAQGCATFISGPKSSGKTFLNYHILGAIFGGCKDASEFLMGNTNFNKGDSEVYIWALDDNKGVANWDNKRAFSGNVKKYVANPRIRVEPKGRDSFEIPWCGRMSVTCNMDKESRAILPQTHGEILDKICMFEWNCWKAKFLPNKGSEAVVLGELPFFLKWLVDWSPPDAVIDPDPRFGARPYNHPHMLADANENSGATRLKEMIDEFVDNLSEKTEKHLISEKLWVTPHKLRKLLIMTDGNNRSILEKELGRERMAQSLQELGFETRRCGHSTEYCLNTVKK